MPGQAGVACRLPNHLASAAVGVGYENSLCLIAQKRPEPLRPVPFQGFWVRAKKTLTRLGYQLTLGFNDWKEPVVCV